MKFKADKGLITCLFKLHTLKTASAIISEVNLALRFYYIYLFIFSGTPQRFFNCHFSTGVHYTR